MKIVIIHGQSHKETSYHVGRALVDELEGKESIKEFFMPKHMPKFCTGCMECMNKGEEFCPHYKYMEPIFEAIEESDLLVFTTPVYCLRTTASMKALLDHLFVRWISHRPKAIMYCKRAVIVSAGAGAGMKKAAADIKTSLNYMGMSNVRTYKVKTGASKWEEVLPELKHKIKFDMDNLADKLEKENHLTKVSIKNKVMFLVMRKMQLANKGACQLDRDYWEKMGYLDKKRPW